jgi:hypothetical protein
LKYEKEVALNPSDIINQLKEKNPKLEKLFIEILNIEYEFAHIPSLSAHRNKEISERIIKVIEREIDS